MSVGSVQTCCESVSTAIASTHEGLIQTLRAAPVVHADETSFGQCEHKRMWAWAGCTATTEAFLIRPGRGQAQAQELLGKTFDGVIVRDRWRPYESIKGAQSQLCWAHLRRHFQSMIDFGGLSTERGRSLMDVSNQVFHHWHVFRDGSIDRVRLQEAIRPLSNRMDACLDLVGNLEAGHHKKFAGMARDLLRQWSSLWVFTTTDGVEPTNNAAEQAVRKLVLWRKSSFGANSDAGCCFVERIISVVGTAKRRGIDALEWLTGAVQNQIAGMPTNPLIA